jgi:peptide/nickel transport system permease protein
VMQAADARGADARLLRRGGLGLGWAVAAGGLIILFWMFVIVTIDLWSPYDPLRKAGPRLVPPGAAHWLGTDTLGRDVLTRTLYGARQSLPIAVAVVVASALIGTALGALAGFVRGLASSALMRPVDVTMSIPPMILAMAITASLGPGLFNAAIAMILVTWPLYARLMHSQVLAVREMEHVEAAVAGGATRARLILRHILPLCMTPVFVNATMDLGQITLLAASLSFIGLGASPPTPEWGSMITDGATRFYEWWVALGPGLAILSVVLGFSFMGDGLRDLLDPRSRP